MSCSRSVVILAAVWLVVGAAAMPVRRSPDLEARRRSAIDRSMIRQAHCGTTTYKMDRRPSEERCISLDAGGNGPVALEINWRAAKFYSEFGRSYPQELTAADLREAFQLPSRRGNSFLRFGRSQPLTISTEDLVSLLKAYDDEYNAPSKKSASFVRFGRNVTLIKDRLRRQDDDKRDPIFDKVGKATEDNNEAEQISELLVSGYPQRKNRARDHFIRLGRDSEELNDGDEEESRKKRSADPCSDCQS